jgi:alpha-ketoglutarate-dependent taurine dioxygenase
MIVSRLGFGSMLESRSAEELQDVDVGVVDDLFRASGFVLFRGFHVDDERFARFTQTFSGEFVTHGSPTRPQVGPDAYLTMADPGTREIHFHSELCYLPDTPDVLWFCCMTPPGRDGQTIVCDGIELWSLLGDSLRQPFLEQKLRYTALWQRSVWHRYFHVDSVADLKRTLEPLDGISYKIGQGDRLFLDYRTPAVRTAKYSATGGTAFVNAVLHWCLDGLYDFVAFEEAGRIDKALVSDIQALADRATFAIEWRTGDVALIDNTRVMHGRRPFTDTARKLHVRMGRSFAPALQRLPDEGARLASIAER